MKEIRWKKRLIVATAAFGLLFGTTACGNNGNVSTSQQSSGSNQKSDSDQLQEIRIGYLNVMDDAQAMLASEGGFYKKHGLDVKMQMFNSGTDLIKAIVGGQLDAGVLGFTNALTWLDKGADIKIVGGAQMGYHSMLVRKDSGIESLADLKGKSVASQQQGSTADIVLNGVVWKKAGITKNDVQMQYVSPSVAIQSLAAGKVDAAFVFEPYDSIARLTTPVKQIYEVGQEWPFPCMVVITSGKMVKENKDAVYALLDAQKEAVEMLKEKPAESAKLITKHFIKENELETSDGKKIAAMKVIEESIKSQTFEWKITPEQVEKMQEIADMMVEQGILKRKIDVKNALDLSWQEQVKE
ncbi:NitT/TauT family transport system substrate-binding protein [Anoxybacillus tepidamans]|uniref:NitT/TauT family transport system substrate-binding protein n=1 Tax=Anoxybacteroides tepidamans TaxID=265948 RepID=A0A7W8IS29_9BACL|nr:ABC transporter substrate-binding protein [Anoxybacillus tepidamans]MBB5325609.1 NitT/TauT family transport system substrate-binding protein [Anoxybacillus tepidamans]